MTIENTLLRIIRSGEACPAETLMPLFDKLAPASAQDMADSRHKPTAAV